MLASNEEKFPNVGIPLPHTGRACRFLEAPILNLGWQNTVRGTQASTTSFDTYEGIENALRKSFSSALLRAAAHNFLYLLVFNEASKMA